MSKTKILIVEDEMIVAENLSRQLEKRGFHILDTLNSCKIALTSAPVWQSASAGENHPASAA